MSGKIPVPPPPSGPSGSSGTTPMGMGTLSFSALISKYSLMQSNVAVQIQHLASMTCQASPGAFLMLQFQMAQITQIGDSLSNLIGQVQSVIKNAVGNQRVQ